MRPSGVLDAIGDIGHDLCWADGPGDVGKQREPLQLEAELCYSAVSFRDTEKNTTLQRERRWTDIQQQLLLFECCILGWVPPCSAANLVEKTTVAAVVDSIVAGRLLALQLVPRSYQPKSIDYAHVSCGW
eukprot:COSAG02_NODE_4421_length_5377_cov_4.815839_2_plen_130_part_00